MPLLGSRVHIGVYVGTYIYTCIYIYIYIHTHIVLDTHTNMYIYICIYVIVRGHLSPRPILKGISLTYNNMITSYRNAQKHGT